jgi:hypothetical protein
MALTKCKECGKDMSTEAKACPSCGAPPPRRTTLGTWVIGGFFAFVVGSCILSQQSTHSPAPATPEQLAAKTASDRRHTATGGCREFIKRKLHDPESAEFGHSSEASVEYHADRAMVVRSVRAKNAFGAMRLTEFICVMEMKDGQVRALIVAERGGPKGDALARQFLTGSTK